MSVAPTSMAPENAFVRTMHADDLLFGLAIYVSEPWLLPDRIDRDVQRPSERAAWHDGLRGSTRAGFRVSAMCDHRWMLRAVLFDLDGVIRHFATDHVSALERRHGMEPGTIARFAFTEDVLEPVVTGRVTRAAWIDQIGAYLGNAEAAAEWGRTPSIVDPQILEIVDDVRAAGHRTAILTNGTDTIDAEIDSLGLAPHFDQIFNSADLGFAKPDTRAFQHVLDRLELTAAEVFFTDDSQSKLAGAETIGMPTHLFRGASDLRSALRAHGVRV